MWCFVTYKLNDCIISGTFAIVCLMTGKAVAQYSTEDSDGHISNGINNETSIEPVVQYTKYEVAMAVTFTVALFHVSNICLMHDLALNIVTEKTTFLFLY